MHCRTFPSMLKVEHLPDLELVQRIDNLIWKCTKIAHICAQVWLWRSLARLCDGWKEWIQNMYKSMEENESPPASTPGMMNIDYLTVNEILTLINPGSVQYCPRTDSLCHRKPSGKFHVLYANIRLIPFIYNRAISQLEITTQYCIRNENLFSEISTSNII